MKVELMGSLREQTIRHQLQDSIESLASREEDRVLLRTLEEEGFDPKSCFLIYVVRMQGCEDEYYFLVSDKTVLSLFRQSDGKVTRRTYIDINTYLEDCTKNQKILVAVAQSLIKSLG